MPALISTADINAEMLLGAAGCASGSQTCNGITPAFTPKPKKNSPKSRSRVGPDTTCPVRIAENDIDPAADARVKNAAARAPVPTCDMTRYKYAARSVVRVSCSVATSAAVASVMTSHANRKPITSLTTNTTLTAAMSTLNVTLTAGVRDGRTA